MDISLSNYFNLILKSIYLIVTLIKFSFASSIEKLLWTWLIFHYWIKCRRSISFVWPFAYQTYILLLLIYRRWLIIFILFLCITCINKSKLSRFLNLFFLSTILFFTFTLLNLFTFLWFLYWLFTLCLLSTLWWLISIFIFTF